ncbi:MAG: hypothetical protein M1826_006695 [Phylliscum demangeonii]|nr:MAG: hypothetical protein M1826_006695 [Phylliscum demangeonii]
MTYAAPGLASTAPGQGNGPPVCQNCTTSTTPLWRRDEAGSILCNACGLFLKLHGRPRPISLKTDVIKSRNRVKNSGQGQKRKVRRRFLVGCKSGAALTKTRCGKTMYDGHSLAASRADAGTPPPGTVGQRRTSGRTSSGASVASNSPVSRTVTPGMPYGLQAPIPRAYAGAGLIDPNLPPSSNPATWRVNQPSPGSTVSGGERYLETPHTYEALLAANASLRTRVNELEVINDLFRGRVTELEQQLNYRPTAASTHSEPGRSPPGAARAECYRREDDLKRRIDELEQELREPGPRSKKMRVSDIVDDENDGAPSTPQSTVA